MVRRGVGGVLVGLNGENQQVRPVRETASPPLQRGTPLGRGSRLKEAATGKETALLSLTVCQGDSDL